MAWDMELRPGNTKSGVGAGEQIRRAFAAYKFTDEKYLSGDAAYCKQENMTTSISVGAFFTFTANQATTGWEDHIDTIVKWEPWVYTQEEIKEAVEKDRTLPELELGRFYVVLLHGGDKKTQDSDIETAKEYWRDYLSDQGIE